MSYSFSVHAADKDAAIKAVEGGLDEVIANQPMHKTERDVVIASLADMLKLVNVGDGMALSLSIHGSVGWNGVDDKVITGLGFGINVQVVPV